MILRVQRGLRAFVPVVITACLAVSGLGAPAAATEGTTGDRVAPARDHVTVIEQNVMDGLQITPSNKPPVPAYPFTLDPVQDKTPLLLARADDAPRADNYFQEGKRYFDRGDLRGAIAWWEKALEADSDHVRAQYFLAQASNRLGEEVIVASAGQQFAQMTVEEQVEYHLAAGKAAMNAEDFQRAIEHFNKVLAIEPENRTAQRAIEQAGDELAEMDPEAAAEMEADAPDAMEAAEPVAEEVEQTESEPEMAEAMEAPAESGPSPKEQSDALYEEGRAYFEQGNYRAAVEKFESALEISPQHDRSYTYLNQARARIQEMEQEAVAEETRMTAEEAAEAVQETAAEEMTEPAEELAELSRQERVDHYYQQGRTLAASGRYQEALQSFDQALSLMPNHIGAQRAREDAAREIQAHATEMALEEQDRARDEQRAAESQAMEAELAEYLEAAEIAYANGQYETAAAEARNALDLAPSHEGALRILELAQAELDKMEPSEEPVVEMTEQPEPMEQEMPADEMAEDAETMVEETVEVTDSAAQEARARVEHGQTYLSGGLLEEAVQEFQAALDLDPTNAQARQGLQTAQQRMEEQARQQTQMAAETKAAEDAARAEEALKHFERGKYLDEQGDLIGAMEEWQMALELDPDFSEAQAYVDQKMAAYEQAVEEKQEAEEEAAREAEYEAALDKVPAELFDFADADIDELLNTIAAPTDFNITVAADVEGEVSAFVRGKTLREILNILLLPNGWKWERIGNDIYVTTDFQTEIFTLPPQEYEKLEDILLDPERLENPELSLQRLLWGPEERPTVQGTDLRLNPKTHQLIVTDSEANIEKVREFLANLPSIAASQEPLVVEIYPLKPEIATKLYRIIQEALDAQIEVAREGRQLLLDDSTNTLIVRDTQDNIELVEQILTDKAIQEGLTQSTLEARKFRITFDQEPGEEGKFRRREIVEYTIDILEHMLYTQEGREEAIIRGRRIFAGREPDFLLEKEEWDYDGTITVVDTPENLKRVESYLATVGGQTQVTRFMKVTSGDVERLVNLLNRVTGRVRETSTEGGTIQDDFGSFNQQRSGGIFGNRLNLQVRMTPDPITNSIIAIAPDVQVLDEIETLLQQLDEPEKQVEIESRLVEVSQDDIDSYNVDLSLSGIGRESLDPFDFNTNPLDVEFLSAATADGGTQLSFGILGETQLSLLVNWIRRTTSSEILSAPKVTTVSAPPDPASINITTLQPFISSANFDDQGDDDPTNNRLVTEFDTVEVGIILEVNPRVLPDGYVIMNIQPEVSVISDRLPVIVDSTDPTVTSTLGDLGQPVIDTREADVTVRVKDGDTLAIGGLIRDEVLTSERRVPFFSDLPIVGALFREENFSRTKTSLLLLVTVRVIPNE